MKLVCRNTNLGAQSIFETICEARRRIVHDRTGIHLTQESRRRRLVLGNDTFSVIRAKRRNMLHGSLNMIDHSDG